MQAAKVRPSFKQGITMDSSGCMTLTGQRIVGMSGRRMERPQGGFYTSGLFGVGV